MISSFIVKKKRRKCLTWETTLHIRVFFLDDNCFLRGLVSMISLSLVKLMSLCFIITLKSMQFMLFDEMPIMLE